MQDAKLLLEKMKKDLVEQHYVSPTGTSPSKCAEVKRMCVFGNAHFLPFELELEKPPEKSKGEVISEDEEDEEDDDDDDDKESEEEEEEKTETVVKTELKEHETDVEEAQAEDVD